MNVQQHTDLKGGLITSTEKAEAEHRNRFQTATLAHSDIQNHSRYSGTSFGIGAAGGFNADLGLGSHAAPQSSATTTDADGNRRLATGTASAQISQAIGFGFERDSQSSVTKSGINTQNIVIGNAAVQQHTSGQTVAETIAAVKTDINTDNAAAHSGRLNNRFEQDKVLKELNLQVKVTKEFRQNAFSVINQYTLPKQAELREQIKQATSEEEKTEIYNEIYKLQYQKRFLETLVGIVAGTPDAAITQGTLQLAATKMREESLANSRKSPGIVIDSQTGQVINNVSYDSGYFDGVKLGGVRLDLDIICGKANARCNQDGSGNLKFDSNGNYIYIGDEKYPVYQDLINDKNVSSGLDGPTGGFQPSQGGWYLPGGITIPYGKGSTSDKLVESFAGTHDYLGGQIWGWYGKDGNTSRGRNAFENIASSTTTVVAIPVSAPFAVSDLISPDVLQIILKIGGK